MEKHKKKIIIGLVVASVTLILVSIIISGKPRFMADALGVVVIPLQGATQRVGNFVSGKMKSLSQLGELEEENTRLREENEALRFSNSRLAAVEKENHRLAELLETDLRYKEFKTVGAHIIAKDPGNWYNSFLINKGVQDGICENMVVIGDGGLIGRVLEVGNQYAKVVALIDDNSTVSAMSVRTEDIGYIKGDISLMLEGLCRMEFLDMDAQLAVGDEIVTSHLSSLYPPGIVIGTVKEVEPDSHGTKYALVKPQVDFSKLEMVLVIVEDFSYNYPQDAIEDAGYKEQ